MTQTRDDEKHPNPAWEARVHAALVAASDDGVVSEALLPDPSRIWAAVQGELPPNEAQEVIDAALLDPETYAELRLALAMTQELAQDQPAATVAPKRKSRVAWYAPVLALAAALVAIWSLRPRPDPVPTGPGSSYRESTHAAVETALPPGGTLPRTAFLLKWQAVVGGRYTVSVSTEDAKLITHVQGLRTPNFQVPEQSLADLPSGAKVLWRVEVIRTDGSRDKSATFVAVLE
ncbi:MAG: hypothetical protein JKY37_11310 [Nannocystaceae bacterium]|nr:hypothetical protein [Nannocystaceae bacterium]